MLCSCLIASVFIIILELLTELNAKPQPKGSSASVDPLDRYQLSTASPNIENGQGYATVKSQFSDNEFRNTSRERSQKNSKQWGYSSSEYSDQDMIFPDLFDLLYDEPLPRIRGPPKCADGKTFCENVETYPYRHLKKTLRKNPMYKDLFGTDEAPIEITNRVGGDQSRYFCASVVSTIYPQIGKNKNNKWKFIINQKEDDGVIQGVLVETCRKPNTPCDVIGELPLGYTTSCKQKYIYRRLLSLDGSGIVSPDSFQIPTACCCSYTRSSEILARFGAPVTPTIGKKPNSERIHPKL